MIQVWWSDVGLATVFGHEPDIAAVELLCTSLLVQADAAMAGAGRQVDALGRSRARSFRQSLPRRLRLAYRRPPATGHHRSRDRGRRRRAPRPSPRPPMPPSRTYPAVVLPE